MSWKETNVMDLRTEFITKSLTNAQSFISLCKEYGISTKTGYKWKKRFYDNGINGLYDQSRRPQNSPSKLDEDVVCELIKLKNAHPRWGAAKIISLYCDKHNGQTPACLSSVKRIFDKAGLVKKRKRRKAKDTARIVNDIAVKEPNDLWTVDFKGSWYSSDNKRIEPLTVRDAYSRYVLCSQVLANSKTETVKEYFKLLFEQYGLPAAIHSDNGTPFASSNSLLGLSRLSVWWLSLGITLNRSRPGKPQDNGGHERMHGDLAEAVEYVSGGDLITQQKEIELWRKEFNEVRAHQALGMAKPAEFYRKSDRNYDGDDFELEYPAGYLKRLVGKTGLIRMSSRRIFISTALYGYHVGLQPCENYNYLLWLGDLYLGELDSTTELLVPAQQKK
jgi:putative transposase